MILRKMAAVAGFLSALLFSTCALAQTVTPPAENNWALIPGTACQSVFQANNTHPNLLSIWSSIGLNTDTKELVLPRIGGHADYQGTDSYSVNINAAIAALPVAPATTHCRLVEPIQPLIPPASGNACPLPAHGPAGMHLYDGVEYIGNNEFLHMGTSEFASIPCVNRNQVASIIDTDTPFSVTQPWTWTHRPDMTTSAAFNVGYHTTARSGSKVYIVASGKVGIFDIPTKTLGPVTLQGGVLLNGVTSSMPGFNSSLSEAGISSDGYYILGDQNNLCVSNINGGVRDIDNNGTLDNDTFGRFTCRTVGAGAAAGSIQRELKGQHTVVPLPDGRVVLWRGTAQANGDVITFKPGLNNNPALDTWQRYTAPSTIPANTSTWSDFGVTYRHCFWLDDRALMACMVNVNQGIWLYHVPDTGPPPPVNTAPTAVNDNFAGTEDGSSVAGSVLSNDTDPEGNTLTAALVKSPYAGVLTLNSNGSFTYVPPTNFNGTTSFEYRATDTGALSDLALSTITIAAVNDAPVTVADNYAGDINLPVSGNVLTNDSDPVEGTPLSATMISDHASGNLVLNSNGSFIYTPSTGFEGQVTATYSASDGQNSATGTITITIGDEPPADPNMSFAELCALPETVLCDPLDDTPITGPGVQPGAPCLTFTAMMANCNYGAWRWDWPAGVGGVDPSLDAAMGEGGALKFTIPPESNANTSGSYTVNLSSDYSEGIAMGETAIVQMKVRWSCDVLYTDCDPQSPTYKEERRHYDVTAGVGGIKVFSLGERDIEGRHIDSGEGYGTPVWGNCFQDGYLCGYISIWNEGIETSWQTHVTQPPPAPQFFFFQRDRQPGGPTECLASDPVTGLAYDEGGPDCFRMEADEWVTLRMELEFESCSTTLAGPANNNVKLLIANEGETFTTVVDHDVVLRCSDLAGAQLGKIFITPYNTAKDPAEVHPTGYVWIDSLWVGRI